MQRLFSLSYKILNGEEEGELKVSICIKEELKVFFTRLRKAEEQR